MTGLRYRTALHINSLSLREMIKDISHLLLAIYKPFTANNKTCSNITTIQSLFYKFSRTLKSSWQSHYLSIFAFATAICIMVCTLSRYNNIQWRHLYISTSSDTRRYNKVWLIMVYHLYCTDCRINLSDTALLQHHFVVANLATNEIIVVPTFLG